MSQNHDLAGTATIFRSTISTSGPNQSSVKSLTGLSTTDNATHIPPLLPVFKISFDLCLSQLLHLNTIKFRESGEWMLLVKVFFLTDKPAAVSEAIPISAVVCDLEVRLPISLDVFTYGDINTLVHHPLVVNFYEIEIITRDPKKKTTPEEKVDLLGQCLVDLLPLVLGGLNAEVKLPVFLPARPIDPLDERISEQLATLLGSAVEEPAAVVTLHTDQPLIPEEFARLFNILTLDIGGCYQLPPPWLIADSQHGSPSTYTIATHLPSTSKHERFLLVTGQALQVHSESTQQRVVRWPSHPLFISKAVSMQPVEASLKGPVLPVKDMDKPCIMVNTQFRCVLSKDAEDTMKTRAIATKVWPVEIFNLTYPEKHVAVTKKKNTEVQTSVTEDATITRHGVAYIDIAPLSYPGTKTTSGDFLIIPYEAHDFHQRTGCKSAGLNVFSVVPNPMPNTDAEKPVAVPSTKISQAIAPSHDGANVAAPQINCLRDELDKQMFLTNQSFMQVKITLHEALVPKKRRGEANFTVEDIRLPRLSEFISNDNGFLAIQEYREEVKHCYALAAALYNKAAKQSSDWVQIYKNIEKEMYTSGELNSLKDRLKRHILKIVRDRFYRVNPFRNDGEYQGFLSDLYADLVREINLTFHPKPQQTRSKSSSQDSIHLRILAQEAEIDGKHLKAEQLLLHRVTETDEEGRDWLWIELGLFQLRHKKFEAAVETLSEALLNDRENLDYLLLLAYALFVQDKPNQVLPILQAVAALSNSPVAWTALGIFYESLAHDTTGGLNVLKERAFYQANVAVGHDEARMKEYKIQLTNLERLCGAEVPNHLSDQEAVDQTQLYLQTLLHPVIPTTQHASICYVDTVSPLFRSLEQLQDFDVRKKCRHHPRSPYEDNIFYYSLPYFSGWGLIRFANRCIVKLNGICPVNDPVFWRSAMAVWMTGQRWLEAAQLLDELAGEHECSATYNVHRGTLAHIRGDVTQAARSFDAALAADICSWDRYAVYYRYGQMAQTNEDHHQARVMFQRATQLHGTAAGWLGCGVASFYLGDWLNAEFALNQASVLDGTDARIWAYLAMVFHRGDRTQLAGRHFQTAQQCGLDENDALYQEVEDFLKTHFSS